VLGDVRLHALFARAVLTEFIDPAVLWTQVRVEEQEEVELAQRDPVHFLLLGGRDVLTDTGRSQLPEEGDAGSPLRGWGKFLAVDRVDRRRVLHQLLMLQMKPRVGVSVVIDRCQRVRVGLPPYEVEKLPPEPLYQVNHPLRPPLRRYSGATVH